MVSYNDLTDRAAVEWAMAEFDRRGRDAFLHAYGYGEAREYFLVSETGRYDSKAIFAAAFEKQHGIAIAADQISGGKTGAAQRLAELGFEIEGIDDRSGRTTFATFDEALRHYRIPMENLPLVRAFLGERQFKEFYIPRGGSYIAAVPASGINKAFIHSGYIWHRTAPGQGEEIELPVNRIRDGGYWKNTNRPIDTADCPIHFIRLPLSGVCPFCE